VGLYKFFFSFLPELVIQRYGHWRDVIQKKKYRKKKESWLNSVHYKTQQSAKNTSFLQNESTNIKKQRAHMPYFSDRKSQSSHTNIHFIFVKLCKKPIKIKKDISSVPRVRKLVVKTQQWHILYIVWSLLTLYRVLHGDQKHRKSFCTKDNAKKNAEVCTRRFHAARPDRTVPKSDLMTRTEPKRTAGSAYGGKDSKRIRTQQKKGCVPWQKAFREEKNQGTT